MAGLYLSCRLCGRKQAEGLLSRAAWGHVALEDGTSASACPACKAEHADWEQRVGAAEDGAPRYGASFGSSYGSG
jgi:hypothetical protein